MAFLLICVPLKPELASLWGPAGLDGNQGVSGECVGERRCREQGLGALHGFSGRVESEIGGDQREVRKMCADDSRRRTWREGQRLRVVQPWEAVPPLASLTLHCTVLSPRSVLGLG